MPNITKLAILSRDRSNQPYGTSLDKGAAFSDGDGIGEGVNGFEVDELEVYYWTKGIIWYKGLLDTTRDHAFKITAILTQVVEVYPVVSIGWDSKGCSFAD